MAFQTVFKRYELKYMITCGQKEQLLTAMAPYMQQDEYGRATIRNIYYDTDTYLLIRRSMEKPVYKEKLRVRSYSRTLPDSGVFVELKKKYKHIVYKRRIRLPEGEATGWLTGQGHCQQQTQISREIDYFLSYYKTLRPVVFLSYEREAYYARDGSDFRVTFDDTVLCRQEALSLGAEVYGMPLLPEGMLLMELKCSGGIPLWMTRLLSEKRIYKTSFSKYAEAYRTIILPKQQETYKTMMETTKNA